MKQLLIELLQTFGYPVGLQGSYEEGQDLPETFITFWNYETNLRYYDNDVKMIEYVYRVYAYSSDPEIVNDLLGKVRKLLLNNNFFCSGDFDIESGKDDYDAREMEVRYLKTEKEEN